MSEFERNHPEISAEVRNTLDFADQILEGRYTLPLNPDSHDPAEVFEGPLLDLENNDFNELEINLIMKWMESRLGGPISSIPTKPVVDFDDGITVTVFALALGMPDDPWYISRWDEPDKAPSFVFWSEEMYEENGLI